MKTKGLTQRLNTLLARQAKLRDQMRELEAEVSEHCENADEAVRALEEASDAVSRLI